MKLEALWEVRKNPLYNPKLSPRQELINILRNHPDAMVSFRSIDKIGINPQSKFDTPNGIYFYPLSVYEHPLKNKPRIDTVMDLEVVFPYAAHQPHIYIAIPKSSAVKLDVSNYTDHDLMRDVAAMKKLSFSISDISDEIIDRINAFSRTLTSLSVIDIEEFESALETEAHFLMRSRNKTDLSAITKHLPAYYDAYDRGDVLYAFKDRDVMIDFVYAYAYATSFEKNAPSEFWNMTRLMSKNPNKWNKLLRRLGYDYAIDTGRGIIHSNEPVQVVFFNPTAFEVIKTIYNR